MKKIRIKQGVTLGLIVAWCPLFCTWLPTTLTLGPGGTKGAAFLKGLYYCRVIKSDAKAVAALSGAQAGTATAGIDHRVSANKNL